MTEKKNLQHQSELTRSILNEMKIEKPELQLIMKNQLVIMEALLKILPKEKMLPS